MVEKVDVEELEVRIRNNLTRERESRLQLGRDLALAKSIMSRGKFGKWLKDKFQLSTRSAQRYMEYAQSISELKARHNVEYDSLSYLAAEAVCALASAPEEVQRAIVEDIDLGFRPPSGKVKRMCSGRRQGSHAICAAVQENKITSYPSLKSMFGEGPSITAQKALSLLETNLGPSHVLDLMKLIAAAPDAFIEAVSRKVRTSAAGNSVTRRH